MEYTDSQMQVFLDRYALKDEAGNAVESRPDQMWDRVAEAIGDTPSEVEDYRNILYGFKFVPGGRILASAGSGHQIVAYNCFVLPVESNLPGIGADSREAIFETMGRMVGIMSRGGGVGINWSVLRPTGSYLRRINGTSSGPIGWMDVASRAVGEVIQGGSRRGAAMFMLADWHPDIDNFIDAKRGLDKITNANVSVAVSTEFMDAVEADGEWRTRFPDTSHPLYNSDWDGDLQAWESNGLPVVEYQAWRARDLWRKIAEAAWDNGEPGIVFLDRAQELSTAGAIEKIISVNPCGEQPLGPYSVCNLGSLNLDAYVKDGRFSFFDFAKDAKTAVRFLDTVIDKTYYMDELPLTKVNQEKIRRIGLGVMGLADALIRLGYRYGSPEAIEFTRKVFFTLKVSALKSSAYLASEKGYAPGWEQVAWEKIPYLDDIPDDVAELVEEHGLRNLVLLTQAPTGTTSMLAGVNSGIEPYFAFGYWRDDRLGKRWVDAPIKQVRPRGFERPIAVSDENVWVSANEVTVEEHIAMQAAAQEFIDASVSKTINAPNSHTVEDVEKAYTLAWKSGLKGVAYFRDGCGRTQVLTREGASPEEACKRGEHDTFRKDGCTYCANCDWSACSL